MRKMIANRSLCVCVSVTNESCYNTYIYTRNPQSHARHKNDVIKLHLYVHIAIIILYSYLRAFSCSYSYLLIESGR